MKTIKIKINSSDEMTSLGETLTNAMYPNLVLAMNGDLGAGKTTFTKGLGRAFGIKRVINSPTFTIMKVYDCVNCINQINRLYHLDVYRITSSSDDFELEEYFHLGGVSVVEWADIIKDLLPDTLWKVTIEIISETERLFTLSLPDEDKEEVTKLLEGEKYEIIY